MLLVVNGIPYIFEKFVEMAFSPVLDELKNIRENKKIKTVKLIKPNDDMPKAAALTLLKEGLERQGKTSSMSIESLQEIPGFMTR